MVLNQLARSATTYGSIEAHQEVSCSTLSASSTRPYTESASCIFFVCERIMGIVLTLASYVDLLDDQWCVD